MGKRGPPPKPAALKKAQGTFRKDRESTAPVPVAATGEMPAPKGFTGVAKRRWNEIVPELQRIGTLAVIDGGALEAYCRAFARWSQLEQMAEDAPVGDAATEARKLHKEVIQPLELALGLHYAARSRVQMPEKESEDPVEKDIFGDAPALTAIAGGKAGT